MAGGQDREDFVIASKVYFALSGRQRIGLSRKIVMAEIEGTLGRLGTDYLDIYYIHGWHDPSPLEETLAALNDLVRRGKVHYIGVSNFASWQLVLANEICRSRGWAPVSAIQPRYNAAEHVPFTMNPVEMALPDLFDACRYLDVAVCSFSPRWREGSSPASTGETQTGRRSPPRDQGAHCSSAIGSFPTGGGRCLAKSKRLPKRSVPLLLRWRSAGSVGLPDLRPSRSSVRLPSSSSRRP